MRVGVVVSHRSLIAADDFEGITGADCRIIAIED